MKFWGGLAGLVTFAFTVWDRTIRARPWAEPHIAINPDYVHSHAINLAAPVGLRIHNPGVKTIGVRRVRFLGIPRDRLVLSEDFEGPVHPRRLMPVSAGEARIFNLTLVPAQPGEDDEATVYVIVDWRPLAARLPRIPLLMRTSRADLRRVQDAERRRGRQQYPR